MVQNNDHLAVRPTKPIIGIIGGHFNNTNILALKLAEKAGKLLAENNLTIACGGEDGIMEYACMGAKSANGTTIAITKSNDKNFHNDYIDYVIPTSLDLAFMNVLVWSSNAMIAFDGRFGTMCEIGLILDIGKPVVLLGKHELINTVSVTSDTFLHLREYSDENIEKAIVFIKKYI